MTTEPELDMFTDEDLVSELVARGWRRDEFERFHYFSGQPLDPAMCLVAPVRLADGRPPDRPSSDHAR